MTGFKKFQSQLDFLKSCPVCGGELRIASDDQYIVCKLGKSDHFEIDKYGTDFRLFSDVHGIHFLESENLEEFERFFKLLAFQ